MFGQEFNKGTSPSEHKIHRHVEKGSVDKASVRQDHPGNTEESNFIILYITFE